MLRTIKLVALLVLALAVGRAQIRVFGPTDITDYRDINSNFALLNGTKVTFLTGTGAPSAACTKGQYVYLDESTSHIYWCTATNVWTDITGGGSGGAVSSVAGRTGAIVLSQSDISGLVSALGLKAPLAAPVFTGQATIPDFTLAGHSHQNTAGGGTLNAAAVTAGVFGVPRIPDLSSLYDAVAATLGTSRLAFFANGDTVTGGVGGAAVRIPPNVTTTPKFYRQQANGFGVPTTDWFDAQQYFASGIGKADADYCTRVVSGVPTLVPLSSCIGGGGGGALSYSALTNSQYAGMTNSQYLAMGN